MSIVDKQWYTNSTNNALVSVKWIERKHTYEKTIVIDGVETVNTIGRVWSKRNNEDIDEQIFYDLHRRYCPKTCIEIMKRGKIFNWKRFV